MTETPPLPTRISNNQAMATTLLIWHNRNRGLMERIAAGLRALDQSGGCRSHSQLHLLLTAP